MRSLVFLAIFLAVIVTNQAMMGLVRLPIPLGSNWNSGPINTFNPDPKIKPNREDRVDKIERNWLNLYRDGLLPYSNNGRIRNWFRGKRIIEATEATEAEADPYSAMKFFWRPN